MIVTATKEAIKKGSTVLSSKVEIRLNIPFVVNDLTFEQYIDFKAIEQQFFKSEDETDRVLLLVDAIKKVTGGNPEDLDITMSGESIEDLFNQSFQLGLGEPITLLRLYVHIVVLVDNYLNTERKASFSFKHEGQQFFIQQDKAVKLLTDQAYTVGEVIELQQFRKKLADIIKQKGDKDGSWAFSLGLSQMAVLVKKKGESLPSDKKERRKFINQRKKLFSTLPLSVVLDARFFLITILNDYAKSTLIDSSLKERNNFILAKQKNKRHFVSPWNALKLKQKGIGI